MGSHGRRTVGRLLLGSQANEVLAHSKVPALIVRCCTGVTRQLAAYYSESDDADSDHGFFSTTSASMVCSF